MEKEMMDLLRRLGITRNFKGYSYLADAMLLVLEDSDRLLLVTKCVYPEVAKQHGTSAACVERDIRTAAHQAWKQNPAFISELARRELRRAPTASQLLSYMLSYLESMRATADGCAGSEAHEKPTGTETEAVSPKEESGHCKSARSPFYIREEEGWERCV
ncbi:MAG: sporulation initiation factor Spo0A C-terminal domain-containing protein [Oscillospiraceae bacterium]